MIKRLVSKEEVEKRRKRNQIITGIVLAFLMILSTLGFALQSGPRNTGNSGDSTDKLKYNGFEFSYNNGFWVLGNFVFKYNPRETPDLGFGLKDETHYRGIPLYVYSEDEDAKTEMIINLGQIAERVNEACPSGFQCSDQNLPIKTCTDNLIIIREGNSSSIKQQENCVYIEGQRTELVKLTDQFLFKILGIK